jgi:hypothetical protein
MKKIVLLFMVLLLIVIQGSPQDIKTKQVNIEARIVQTNPLFLQADLGFAFGTHSEIFYRNTTVTGNETSSTTTEAIKARLGTGLPFEIAAGYMFNDNLGVQLGIDYFQGLNTKIINSVDGIEVKEFVSAVHLSIVPSVKAQFKAGDMTPYVVLGIDVGVVNDFKTREEDATLKRNTRDYGGISLGVKSALGVEYPLSKVLSVFAQIEATQFSFSPMHGKVTKYEVNGQDEMGNLTTKESKWDYVKSVNSSDPKPDDQPNQVLRQTHSVDNVGLEIGIILRPTLVKGDGH